MLIRNGFFGWKNWYHTHGPDIKYSSHLEYKSLGSTKPLSWGRNEKKVNYERRRESFPGRNKKNDREKGRKREVKMEKIKEGERWKKDFCHIKTEQNADTLLGWGIRREVWKEGRYNRSTKTDHERITEISLPSKEKKTPEGKMGGPKNRERSKREVNEKVRENVKGCVQRWHVYKQKWNQRTRSV